MFPLFSLVPLLAVGLFSLSLKRLTGDNMSFKHMGVGLCVKRDRVMQLTCLTRSQDSAHGRAAMVDKHTHKHTHINTLLWRTKGNPHDQSGRPGDTQSVGDEEMDMV